MMSPGTTIDCHAARTLVAAGAQLVDVRSPVEHAAGALPGAVNLPLQELSISHVKLDADRPIIVYCASGKRSRMAADTLQLNGFDAVHDLGSLENCNAARIGSGSVWR